jgi:hypothetical protein
MAVPAMSSPPVTSDEGHLKWLVRLQRGERAQPADLWDYTQDLRYTEIQRPLLLTYFKSAFRHGIAQLILLNPNFA